MAQVLIGLGAVIFVHELGHFLVAKACGVKCEKFYVGFDAFDIKIGDITLIPRSLVKWQWGETEYGIGTSPVPYVLTLVERLGLLLGSRCHNAFERTIGEDSLVWNIDHAQQLCASIMFPLLRLDEDALHMNADAVRGEPYLHTDITRPGIAAPLRYMGRDVFILVDGQHRCAKALHIKRGFMAFGLSPEASRECLIYTTNLSYVP